MRDAYKVFNKPEPNAELLKSHEGNFKEIMKL
jgi:hypothetical protein